MALVRVHLLGGFLLDFAERNLPPIPSAVGRSLFAYLVTNRSRRHTRDLLAGTFWPDLPESAARRRLSQALWQIQVSLNEVSPERPFIDAAAGDVAFDPPAGSYWLDVEEFDRHVAAAHQQKLAGESSETGDLEGAVALYRGEFLAGFYDDWTTLERERLRADYLSSLERLVAIHKGHAAYDTALSFARRLSLHDPLRESAHREVMRLCFLLGRSNEALQQYERLVSILDEELATVPMTETTELRDHIARLRAKGETTFAAAGSSPLFSTEQRIPLVGRTEERAAVLRRMDAAVGGHGSVVFVEGRSGMGKTRLVEQLVDDAQWRGLSILRAVCTRAERLHPYESLRQALESGLTRLRIDQLDATLHRSTLRDLGLVVPRVIDQLPEVASSHRSRSASRRASTNALVATMKALAELNPTLLVIDDAQWIDADSAGIVAALAGELAGSQLLVCLSYRPSVARQRSELWRALLDIDESAAVERVRLESLDQDGVAALVAESVGGQAAGRDVIEGLFHETGGNPLFVLESLRVWHEQVRDELEEPGVPAPSNLENAVPLSGGVARVIGRRLDGIPRESRAVLDAAAVFGAEVDVATLAASTGLPPATVLTALEGLIKRNAVRETPHGYEPAHEQVRRVVLDVLSPGDREQIHSRIAAALERAKPDAVETLAHHYSAAGLTNKAYDYSLKAARRARRLGAMATAEAHLGRAASLPPRDDRFDLLVEWEDVLDVLGRREDQQRVIDEMQSVIRHERDRGETARRLARLRDHQGRYDEAIAQAQSAVDLAAAGTPEQAVALQRLGLIVSHAGHPGDALTHLQAASDLLVADHGPSVPALEAAVLCDLGNVLCDVQQYGRAADALTRALQRFEEAGDRHGLAEATGQLAIVRMEQGDGASAVDLYTRALELSRELDYRRGEAVNLANLGNALYFEGDVGRALRRYAEAAEVFSAIGDRRGAALLRANAASVRHSVVGDTGVQADVEKSLSFFAQEDHTWGQAFCHEHLASIARHLGDHTSALDHIEVAEELLADGGHRWVEVHLLRLSALVHLDLGDLGAAERKASRALQLCRELGLDEVVPTIESIAALIALDKGEEDAALARARRATESIAGRVELAHIVWYRHYVVAHQLGYRDEAREALARSVAMLDELVASLPPQDRGPSQRDVPEHRAIVDARDRTFSRAVAVDLPRLGIPLGRPIRQDEMATVSVTVTDPSDFGEPAERLRRWKRIQRMVGEAEERGATMRVKDLAELLEVSIATVRRDISALRRSGVDVHTRGSR